MKKEIKFSLVYRDMWQSSGKYQPRVDQLVRIAPLIIEMGCFARVETNGGGHAVQCGFDRVVGRRLAEAAGHFSCRAPGRGDRLWRYRPPDSPPADRVGNGHLRLRPGLQSG